MKGMSDDEEKLYRIEFDDKVDKAQDVFHVVAFNILEAMQTALDAYNVSFLEPSGMEVISKVEIIVTDLIWYSPQVIESLLPARQNLRDGKEENEG